jgi:hypothetical protein
MIGTVFKENNIFSRFLRYKESPTSFNGVQILHQMKDVCTAGFFPSKCIFRHLVLNVKQFRFIIQN